uniref:Major facilitator superfamily associated domain-containing protein n=1 Tax=Phlebotomus papatasi TaxID=29031 RepID=A0A1B0GNF1_PHLPP
MSSTYNLRLSELAADCMVQKCSFRHGGPDICPPDYKESDDKIFWIYFLLRFLATTMLSAGVTIMDPIALTMIEKYGGDFGRERLFSSIGMAIFSPITGVLIDYTSRGLGYTDYSAAFYTYDLLLIISTVTVLLMPLGEKLPADNVFRDLWNLLKLPHVMIFIIFLFMLGNYWGFIESFLFLYLKELGAPNYLLVFHSCMEQRRFIAPLSSTENINDTLVELEEDWSTRDSSAFFLLDMHPDLGDPIEQLGMEVEQDDNDTITGFKQRFGEKLLWDS